jgi:hypothetical protein
LKDRRARRDLAVAICERHRSLDADHHKNVSAVFWHRAAVAAASAEAETMAWQRRRQQQQQPIICQHPMPLIVVRLTVDALMAKNFSV